jgi:peroxidase
VCLSPFSLISESRSRVGSLRLSDWFNRPVIVESGDNYDFLSRGMATQPEELTDINFDVEIKHFLFRRGMPFGGDLRAIDIQRNRDHGLASYNDFREFCGLRRANAWEDFLDLISQRVSVTFAFLDFTTITTQFSSSGRRQLEIVVREPRGR